MEAEQMGVRRLAALVAGLPPESAVARDGKDIWSRQDELAATAVERAELWFGLLMLMWGAKAKDLPPQVSFEHPDRPKPKKAKPRNVARDPSALRRWSGKT